MWPWGWIAAWYTLWSLAAFIAYWADKRAARRGRRRTRERTLHILELAGGWPGALIAQRTLRHKTRDTSFLLFFWAIVALHIVAWMLWFLR